MVVASIQSAVTRLADDSPDHVGDCAVEGVLEYHHGAETRPFWLEAQTLVEFSLGARGRLLMQPGGTEPKLKIYADLRARQARTLSNGMTH
jgi:phosphomannomutase